MWFFFSLALIATLSGVRQKLKQSVAAIVAKFQQKICHMQIKQTGSRKLASLVTHRFELVSPDFVDEAS